MRSSYLAYATAPSNAGGAMRHGRQRSSGADAVKGSPQQRHTSPSRTGISIQQTSQIGAEEKRGRGEPQRVQQAGNSTDPAASRGLRSTRTTARHADVGDSADGGTSNVMEPESLRKTHLDSEGAGTCHLLTYMFTLIQLRRQAPNRIPLRDFCSNYPEFTWICLNFWLFLAAPVPRKKQHRAHSQRADTRQRGHRHAVVFAPLHLKRTHVHRLFVGRVRKSSVSERKHAHHH